MQLLNRLVACGNHRLGNSYGLQGLNRGVHTTFASQRKDVAREKSDPKYSVCSQTDRRRLCVRVRKCAGGRGPGSESRSLHFVGFFASVGASASLAW